jgi:hypothetical protein
VTLPAMPLPYPDVSRTLPGRWEYRETNMNRWSSALAPNTPEDASTNAAQCLAQAPQGGVFTVTSGGSTQTATSSGSMGTATSTGAGQPTSSGSAGNTGGGSNGAISLNPLHLGGSVALVGVIAFGVFII